MNIDEARILINKKIQDVLTGEVFNDYERGMIEGLRYAEHLVNLALDETFVIGNWYFVLIKDEFHQWRIEHLRLVDRPFNTKKQGVWRFTDKKTPFRLLNFNSNKDIPYKFSAGLSGGNRIFREKEDAERELKNR